MTKRILVVEDRSRRTLDCGNLQRPTRYHSCEPSILRATMANDKYPINVIAKFASSFAWYTLKPAAPSNRAAVDREHPRDVVLEGKRNAG